MGSKIPLAKRKRQNILHRLFAQVMIDAVDLLLRSNFQELLVQRLGGIQIVTERFLDNHSSPMAILFRHQADFRKPLDDVAEVVGRSSQVEEAVIVRVVFMINSGNRFFQIGRRSRDRRNLRLYS